jgi:hypothetical protein
MTFTRVKVHALPGLAALGAWSSSWLSHKNRAPRIAAKGCAQRSGVNAQ